MVRKTEKHVTNVETVQAADYSACMKALMQVLDRKEVNSFSCRGCLVIISEQHRQGEKRIQVPRKSGRSSGDTECLCVRVEFCRGSAESHGAPERDRAVAITPHQSVIGMLDRKGNYWNPVRCLLNEICAVSVIVALAAVIA